VILSMRLRPHPESKPPSYHGSRESRRYRQRQKLLGHALRNETMLSECNCNLRLHAAQTRL
jgi:hypothetical protein